MATTAYAYDLDGTNPLNLVPNEVQYVVPPTSITDTSVVVPRCAPFHADSMVVNTGSLNAPVPLTEGVDFFFVYKFIVASRATGYRIFGGIMFTNRNFNGNIWLTYQTIGGDAVLDDYSVVEQWSRSLRNVRYISWDQLAGLPAGFPVAPHPVGGDTLIGLSAVVDSLNSVAAAITEVNAVGSTDASAGLAQHIASLNAHLPAAVGLGNVHNWHVATINDYNVGTVNAYANAAGVKQYVQNAVSAINANTGGLSDEIAALQGISNNLVADVDVIQAQQTSMGNAIGTLQGQVSTINANNSNIAASVSSGMSQIATMQTTVGAIQSQLDTTSNLTNTNSADIADLQTAQATQATQVTTLTTNQSADHDSIIVLQTNQTTDQAAIAALQSTAPATVGSIGILTTAVGTAQSTADTASALATMDASEIATIQTNQATDEANITTLQTEVSNNTIAIAKLGKPFKLAGTFSKGTFLFTLLPNEQKDFVVVSPGGAGGQFAASAFEYNHISASASNQMAVLNRLSATADGTTLVVGVNVLTMNGGSPGTYGYNDGSDHAGTGGAGGTVILDSGEVHSGSTATAGAAGAAGTTGDITATAGAAGYTIGSVVYGKGQDGVAKAGAGGSGCQATFSVKNTTAYQIWYELQLAFDYGLAATQGGICTIVHTNAP